MAIMTSNTDNLGLSEYQAILCSVGFYITKALIMVNVNKPAQDATIRLDVVKYLVPMVAINVLGLDVNILCLVYADTYFYQVGEQEKVLTEKAPTRSI
ncbi:hypothetical protein BG003_011289 [Podila horticola]|nr:hypothetical protein BG003_011289 [Podila horticola]